MAGETTAVDIDNQFQASPIADRSPFSPIALRPLENQPLVSILIANYNYSKLIPRCLDSLISQTYSHWEAIVVDDGSTDDSAAVIEGYCNIDSRIRLVTKVNGGQVSANNEGFVQSKGEIICLLDSDDIFHQNKLERVVDAFAKEPTAGFCGHPLRVINEAGQQVLDRIPHILDTGWLADRAIKTGANVRFPIQSAISMRRQVVEATYPMPLGFKNSTDNYIAQICQFVTRFTTINDALGDYVIHGHNGAGLDRLEVGRLKYEIKKYNNGLPHIKRFVSKRFGEKIANQLRLDRNPSYMQWALKLRAIQMPSDDCIDGLPTDTRAIIRLLPSRKWQVFWNGVFTLPPRLRRPTLRAVTRSTWIKSKVIRLVVNPI